MRNFGHVVHPMNPALSRALWENVVGNDGGVTAEAITAVPPPRGGGAPSTPGLAVPVSVLEPYSAMSCAASSGVKR